MPPQALETRHAGGEMPTTRWSIVQALSAEPERRRTALEVFAENYWPAVYGFIRMKGRSPQEAEDLTQAFLAGLIDRDVFDGLTEQKGRFRSWLLASLTNFVRNEARDRNRQKRGGDLEHLSIDRDLGEGWLEASASDDASPDVVFDRQWATGILERAMAQLVEDYERQGRLKVVQVLAPMIAGVSQRIGYAEAGEKLGMSEQTARAAAFRMRKRLRRFVRDEVAATVGGVADVDAEIDQLFAIYGP